MHIPVFLPDLFPAALNLLHLTCKDLPRQFGVKRPQGFSKTPGVFRRMSAAGRAPKVPLDSGPGEAWTQSLGSAQTLCSFLSHITEKYPPEPGIFL